MTRCRSCGAALVNIDTPTCGHVVCVRIDLAAMRAIVIVRGEQDLLRLRMREALKEFEGEVLT